MFFQLMQQDPRLTEVFAVVTGIDLDGMAEKSQKSKEESEEEERERAERLKKEREEEELRKKAEAEAAMPAEEREKLQRKKDAEAKKNEGNAAYKNKNFSEALRFYEEAIQIDPTELTFYTNKAAVYFEMKDYAKCIEECDKAI